MTSSAIKVEGIWKLFRLGSRDDTAESLAVTLGRALRSPLSNYRRNRGLHNFDDVNFDNPDDPKNDPNLLWALRDVSFDIQPGELVGIIGRNGAGKSTLLKILSRITPPTRGQITLRGRVSSLLEVGTGFHQDLTGRENVYLNGTILGMRKKEVDRRFDEIVEFSGIARFLDTPVKRYSSGMRVRLAFAVAANLQGEILIIDEVLAVGDAVFQKKCLNKMEDVGKDGRTVLFVSHSMASITRLCQRAILLQAGSVAKDGLATDVVHHYLSCDVGTRSTRTWQNTEEAPGTEVVRLLGVRVLSGHGELLSVAHIDQSIGLEMEYTVLVPGQELVGVFSVMNEDGVHLFTSLDLDPAWRNIPRAVGRYKSIAWIPGNLLPEGTFFVEVAMMTLAPQRGHFKERDAVAFQIVDQTDGTGARGDWKGNMPGLIRPLLDWKTVRIDSKVTEGAL